MHHPDYTDLPMIKVTEHSQMKIRLSPELKARIEAAVANSEIVTRLDAAFQLDKADCEGGILDKLKAIAAEEPPKTLQGTWRNFKEKMTLGLRHAETLKIWKDATKFVGYTPPEAVAACIKTMIIEEMCESQHVILLLQAMKDETQQQTLHPID